MPRSSVAVSPPSCLCTLLLILLLAVLLVVFPLFPHWHAEVKQHLPLRRHRHLVGALEWQGKERGGGSGGGEEGGGIGKGEMGEEGGAAPQQPRPRYWLNQVPLIKSDAPSPPPLPPPPSSFPPSSFYRPALSANNEGDIPFLAAQNTPSINPMDTSLQVLMDVVPSSVR